MTGVLEKTGGPALESGTAGGAVYRPMSLAMIIFMTSEVPP